MKQREARGCAWGRRSLGSIVEPESARAPSLRAGEAPNQELLCGATDPAQPPAVRPVGERFQWAADGWTCDSAGPFHVSQHLGKYPKLIGLKKIQTVPHLQSCACSSHTFSYLCQYPGHCHPAQHDHHSVDAVEHLRVPGWLGGLIVGAV